MSWVAVGRAPALYSRAPPRPAGRRPERHPGADRQAQDRRPVRPHRAGGDRAGRSRRTRRSTVAIVASSALTVGGAAALNNYLERELDARMSRTRRRPTAAGTVTPRAALAFGLLATAAGVAAVWACGGAVAAGFRRRRRRLLRARLHAADQAAHGVQLAARRARRHLPRPDRLDGGRRWPVGPDRLSLRPDRGLVAAPLLGAGLRPAGRLPGLGRAHATAWSWARRRRRG